MAAAGRKLLKDISPLHAEIAEGQHDEYLDTLIQIAQWRQKSLWRKGMQVTFVGTKNPRFEGASGTILKVNTKTITVGAGEARVEGAGTPFAYTAYSLGEYNVSPSLLRKVA